MSLFSKKINPRNLRRNISGGKLLPGLLSGLQKKWGVKIDNLFFCKFLAARNFVRSKRVVWVLPKNKFFAKIYCYFTWGHSCKGSCMLLTHKVKTTTHVKGKQDVSIRRSRSRMVERSSRNWKVPSSNPAFTVFLRWTQVWILL